jgi:hypothetical protein
MFDWSGLLIVTSIGAIGAILGYVMTVRWWIQTGNPFDGGVTRPFMMKFWGCVGLIAPVLHFLCQFHVFR